VREPDPERQAYAGELRHALEAALDAIPAAYRTVFVLREVQGLSTTETAGCLGISEENAKTRLHRARSLLREELFSRAGLVAGDVFLFGGGRCDRVVATVLGRLGLPGLSGR
jgi:RNA polymerase sigma-70 factor (ECF subfamily)